MVHPANGGMNHGVELGVLSYEFHRSHRRRHSAGYHRLNLLVPLSLLLESARFIRRTVPRDEN
jgi:hypothetical protein